MAHEIALYNKGVKPKVYVETSVISYLASRPSRDILIAANQQVTQEWWQNRRPAFDTFISQLVAQEIGSGDAEAVGRRQEAAAHCTYLDITPDAVNLAEKLIERNAIPRQAAEDALHIAVATIHGMDYLVT